MSTNKLRTIDSSKYKALDDREHVLHRPVTYTGSVVSEERQVYFLYADGKIYPETVTIVPAALTFANELLNNAYDEYRRSMNENRARKLSRIDVIVDLKRKSLTVRDDGGIPVVLHKETEKLLPSLLFGQLRTGGNYDDSQRLDVSGVNGLGAVLVNIFSKNFYVDTCDGEHLFRQSWSNNMSIENPAEVIESKQSGFTQIIAEFDDTRLPIEAYGINFARFIEMRCAELAAMGSDHVNPLQVTWKTIHEDSTEWTNSFRFTDFADFLKLWPDYENMIVDKQYRFHIAMGASVGAQESVALVNSIRCDWGTHIDKFVDAAVYHIRAYINQRHKIDVKPQKIRQYIRTISIWQINAPQFASQTKEVLKNKPDEFGMPVVPSEHFIKQLLKSSIVQQLVEELHGQIAAKRQAELMQMQKQIDQRAKRNIMPLQLTDAADAGKRPEDCMLFVVEGDSAKTGFNKHRTARTQGVFAMRGKSLGNMLYRDEIRVMLNKSLAGLMQAAGLSFVKSKLRYNKLVMAQDADFDGYSILGLNLVFFNKFFPECLENGHIYRLKTPIIIARLGNDFRRYYSLSDFHSEEEMLTNAGYQIKYHKGLASLADREYELMMANPMLSKITKDDLSDAAIMNWFGNDSDIRKELMNILAEIDEMSEDDKIDYFNENVIVHFDEL